MNYESCVKRLSQTSPGVAFSVRKMSLAGRMELVHRIRLEGVALAFSEAGSEPKDKLMAAEISSSIESLYVRWGLVSIEGLDIDGVAADVDRLIASGPEALCREIAQAVREQCFLSEEERKN